MNSIPKTRGRFTKQTIIDLLPNWTLENKQGLFRKMSKLGIHQGGIFATYSKNLELYNQLTKDLKP